MQLIEGKCIEEDTCQILLYDVRKFETLTSVNCNELEVPRNDFEGKP